MTKVFTALTLALFTALGGCATPTQSTQITMTLDQLGNSTVQQLTLVEQEANAATPPATDLFNCAASAIVAQAAIQKEFDVTKGQTIGAVSVAAMATLFQPGSAQYNYVVTTLETGCIAEVHDVNQAATSQASIFAAISGLLTLAPAVGL